MIKITTQGNAYERGWQHGAQTSRLIRNIHTRYLRQGALDFDPAPLLRRLESTFPEVIDEMEGIAVGSSISKDQIFRMNLMPLGAGPACSTVGIRHSNGEAWIAKTDDISADQLGSNILRRDIPAHAAPGLHLHFAGTIWTSAAFIANGFCMAMTGLAGAPGPADGIPPQVLWRVLSDRCSTVRQAAEFLEPFALNFGGMSLLLSDSTQNLLLLEKTTQGQCVRQLRGSGPPLCHTNHASMGVLNDPPDFLHTPMDQNSRKRLDTLCDIVPRLPQSWEGLQTLCAHHTPTGALCQHGDAGLHTDYAVILSPSASGIRLAMGPPCKTPFTFFRV